MNWNSVKLEDAYWFQEGPGVRTWQFTDNGIKLLNVANIEKSGNINLAKTTRYLSADEVETRYKHFLCDPGDLVIASSGISFDDDGFLRTRGAFIFDEHLPLCLNTSTIRFKSKDSNDLIFFKHWLQSIDFRRQITKLVTGSAQQNFGPSHLKQLKIPLPPLPEQKRIAAILDKADEIRRKREAAIAKLDKLAQSIFVEMFGDVILNQKSFKTEQLKNLSDRIQIDPFGSQLHEEDYIEGGIPLVNPSHIKLGKIEPDYTLTVPQQKYKKLSQYHLAIGDLIIGRRGEMGRCAVVTDKEHGYLCGTGSLFIRVLKDKMLPEYICEVISSKRMRKHLENVSQGVTMANLNKDIVGALKIVVPPLTMQNEYVTRRKAIEQLKVDNLAALAKQNILFSSLQHAAFSGQL